MNQQQPNRTDQAIGEIATEIRKANWGSQIHKDLETIAENLHELTNAIKEQNYIMRKTLTNQ